ncbi:hypothetical protein [Falsihalocynthiibacter arcticus]|uniref:hypothetical protein n=1 Tax=Falsihalocynthiibacter arcticus TaxID=1579316 RepID=UPI0009EF53BE|nr:hypothetical protein [Falsihalocynthiibacter arcticus]
MIVVIQCAGSKRLDAGTFESPDGRFVDFVANPEDAPKDERFYARPDDSCPDGGSWRDRLVAYNLDPQDNPLRFIRSCELYTPPIYARLSREVDHSQLYILSAGWGLLAADFLTPAYDITFSAQAPRFKRRRKRDNFRDLSMLPDRAAGPVHFFGSKDYVPLFAKLTAQFSGPRIVYYNSAVPPNFQGCSAVRFNTTRRTNWHYSCAAAFLEGDLENPYV